MVLCNETATQEIMGREGQQDAVGAAFVFPPATPRPSCGETCNGDL